MIRSFKQLFEVRIRPATKESDSQCAAHAIRLATAALLVEVVRADHDSALIEKERLEQILERRYKLKKEEVTELAQIAEKEVDASISLDQFTRLLDNNLNPKQKQKVLRLLWDIAFADGSIDKYEEYLIRKLADLLHVPHRHFIAAKLQAEKAYKKEEL